MKKQTPMYCSFTCRCHVIDDESMLQIVLTVGCCRCNVVNDGQNVFRDQAPQQLALLSSWTLSTRSLHSPATCLGSTLPSKLVLARRASSSSAAKSVAEAGGFLVKQKGRAGGGRKKKPQPSSREGTPENREGSPVTVTAAAAPGAEGSQASPSLSPAASPAVEGGRSGNPFEEEERQEVPSS